MILVHLYVHGILFHSLIQTRICYVHMCGCVSVLVYVLIHVYCYVHSTLKLWRGPL